MTSPSTHGVSSRASPPVLAPEDLPLRWSTPASWTRIALADPLRLLCDHAHLERKAATNALELLNRWPGRVSLRATGEDDAGAVLRWTETLARIAQDEIRHLGQVVRLLHSRGGRYERAHENPYAAALRALVRSGRGREEILDRLLVSALIELRSAERFALLANDRRDPELSNLYGSLYRSECGHYRQFLELAGGLSGIGKTMPARWNVLLDAEGAIMAVQEPAARMHGGA